MTTRTSLYSRLPLSLLLLFVSAALVLGPGGCSCGQGNGGNGTGGGASFNPPPPPAPGTPQYVQAISGLYSGLIAVNVSANGVAITSLTDAAKVAPGEPMVWAARGLAYLQENDPKKNDLKNAADDLDKAKSLQPDNSLIVMLTAVLEERRGNTAQALIFMRRAVTLDPKNVQALYALDKMLEAQPNSSAERADLHKKMLEAQPDNIAFLLFVMQDAADAGDRNPLRSLVDRVKQHIEIVPSAARVQLKALEQALAGSSTDSVVVPTSRFRNLMLDTPAHKQALAYLPNTKSFARLPERPLVMQTPSPTPATSDGSLAFTAQPLPGTTQGKWNLARAFTLVPELPEKLAESFRSSAHPVTARPEAPAVTLLANGTTVQIVGADGHAIQTFPYPGGPAALRPSADSILIQDFTYDFLPDIALAGPGGFRLYEQTPKHTFTDVTGRTKLPASVTQGVYTGAWAVDIEADGDLDIVLGAALGTPTVLQNNSDGTWEPTHPFTGVEGLRGFAWGDFDNDGDGDAALIDGQGHLAVFENLRGGKYRQWKNLPADLGKVTAISVADPTRRGTMDIVALLETGSIVRLSLRPDQSGWDQQEIALRTEAANDSSVRLLWSDLDNNGAIDLIVSGDTGTKIFLGNAASKLDPLTTNIDERVWGVDETTVNGLPDLIGLDAGGKPVRLVNGCKKGYHWIDLRPRAQYLAVDSQGHEHGDNRINPFGVGSEAALRAGLLYEKVTLTGPTVHFGLGDNAHADAVRLLWTNGASQAEFAQDLKTGAAFVLSQRIIDSSCPWLFAWDGKQMSLVTDCIWRSPLGLRINAQGTAGIGQTQDWVKIRGDQLVPHDGYYDLRITAELWETHFFDYLALSTVDHPADTDIWVDERFSVPQQPPLKIYTTTKARPIARATDDAGQDVTDIVRERDGRYLATFGVGQYQGVTRDHYVQVDLPADAPVDKPLALIATGWLHPTDSNINLALSQGHHTPPQGLSLEIPDGRGGWKVAKPGLGFPEGKIKTVFLDISGLFAPGIPHQVRLRTNLEIYWDYIAWATILPDTTPRTETRLAPAVADLHFRGWSALKPTDSTQPDMPDYNVLSGTAQRWLDLEGFCTRFGDVLPLLTAIDDRYVIMNSGDELSLRFPEQKAPASGMIRDYVLIGDGWVKDGNFNTAFPTTIIPLPDHAMHDYVRPPTTLEQDPVYLRHAADWKTYHTRYIHPGEFIDALKPYGAQ
jgi:tetratricopeptide (TPR) repeat protein